MNAIHDSASMQGMILTESQIMLREMVCRYVADNAEALALGKHRKPDRVWRDFAENLGILGLTVNEAGGGLACGATEAMLVVEQLGAGLAAEPFVSSAIATATLLNGLGEPAFDLAARIVSGEETIVSALGECCEISASAVADGWRLEGRTGIVVSGAIADVVVVPARDVATGKVLLFALPGDHAAMDRRCCDLLDGNPAAEFVFAGDRPLPDPLGTDDASALVERARDAANAAYCAELVGVMERMLQDTVSYTTQRTQFGQPLARFQVLQHRMAAMYVEVELARSIVLMAAIAIDGAQPDRTAKVRAALARTLKASREVANAAVQLHGGIGTTEELALGRYFKRVRTLISLLGTADSHVVAYAAAAEA